VKTDFQLTDIEYYVDGSIKNATINFMAENVPSIGYKTYYLKPADRTN
jgi:alpha-mannosidase